MTVRAPLSVLLCLLPALLLAACAGRLPLPAVPVALQTPLQLHLQRDDGASRTDRLLVIQAEADGLRWTLLDPLGIPLARQRLAHGRWHADGLLPPNAEARELFAALLFALTPERQLADAYPQARVAPGGRTLSVDGERLWQVRSAADGFELDVGGGLTYGVAPLAGAATP
ncbi:DUF3261 domain-containing protein [Stutzerimonas azotifigens]|uniref:DUF3261 domain-containing protein n=1 Tax=Stutzerimonas azotifigens TaxID=291995 RepID=UPI0003FB1E11|nr:DUF3261 domain-containing protein [Stutzerimonas azotifigens]